MQSQRLQSADLLRNPTASRAAIRTFNRIADAWGLKPGERLTLLGLEQRQRNRYRNWCREPDKANLDADKLERLSYIFGIYKALQMLFPNAEQADSWIRRRNRGGPLDGQSALERMLGGHVADLYTVRQYLDAERGW